MFIALLDTGAQVHLVLCGEGELSTRMALRAEGARPSNDPVEAKE